MADPIRLGVVASTLSVGGAEQLLLDLLERMDRSRFSPRLIFLKDDPGPVGRELLRFGIPAVTGVLSGRLDPLGIPRLRRVLRCESIEAVLLVNHLDSLVYGIPAARLLGVPVVNWHNETMRRYRLHGVTMLGRRLLFKGLDGVVAAAQAHRDYVARAEGVHLGKIRVIYNGVDPARAVSGFSRSEARARLGLPEQGKALVQVAALRPDKAHEIMLEALAAVIRKEPRTTLLVVGDGPRRPFLEQRAADLGLDGHCRFLGVRRDVGDILAASDVAVLSSFPSQETLSVAAIEAMFAGLPLVCTDVGSMAEIVRQGQTGFLVPPGRPEALAQALLEVLGDEGLRLRLGREAERLARQKCHVTEMVKGFEELFLQLTGRLRDRQGTAQGGADER